MVNTCGIEFDSQDSPLLSIVTRDTIVCKGKQTDFPNIQNQNLTQNTSNLTSFTQGSLSVKADKSVVKVSFDVKEPHNRINISMDLIFVLPVQISDAIFKIYFDETSGYIFSTQCGFFTNKNSNQICYQIEPNQNKIKFLRINTFFYHSCDILNLYLEFVARWKDGVDPLKKLNNQPSFFMTNLTVNSSNDSKVTSNILSPSRCNKSFDPLLINFNLFSMQGVPDVQMTTDQVAQANSNRLRCCECQYRNASFSSSPSCYNLTRQTNYSSQSDTTDSQKLNSSNSSTYLASAADLTVINDTITINDYSSVVNFTFHIFCNLDEYSKQDSRRQDIQYLQALIDNNFQQIFQFYLDLRHNDQTIILNNAQITQVNYELIFYGDTDTDHCDCLFSISQQLEITAKLQNVVPSIQVQNILFRSSINSKPTYACGTTSLTRLLNLVITGSFRIIGFNRVSFQNMSLDVSDPAQQDMIVAFLIKPMVLNAQFSLINVKIMKVPKEKMKIMQLKIILDEFQGTLILQNLTFFSLVWLESHSFIEFSQSNRFMDKLYQAKSYRPQQSLYNIMIDNIVMSDCSFFASVNLLTFPTSNVEGFISNIFINNSEFYQGSNILTSFSSIEPVQLENSVTLRELQISNIQVQNSNFSNSSKIISVSLQKVALTKNQTMNLTINNITIINCLFSNFSMVFYNDHSYFNNYLSNILIINTSFSDTTSIATENSDMVSNLELVFSLNQLVLQNTQFYSDSMICVMNNKNILLQNIKLEYKSDIDLRVNDSHILKNQNQSQIKGTLIYIMNFKSYVTLKNLSFSGTLQNNQIIDIEDFLGGFVNVCTISIISCQFQNISLISEGAGQLAGAPLYINSIRQNLSIIINDTQWIGNTHWSSIYNIYLSASLIIEAPNSNIYFYRLNSTNNWCINGQTGLTIISSLQLTIENSTFSYNSFNNNKHKGPGGHLYISSQNISMNQCILQYSFASDGGAIYINHYIKQPNNSINITSCTFSNSKAYSSPYVGEGGALAIYFNIDQAATSIATWANISVTNSTFSENYAEAGCGAIQIFPNVLTNISLNVTGTLFRDNFGLKAFSIDMTHDNNMVNSSLVLWSLYVQNCVITQTYTKKKIHSIINNYAVNTMVRDSLSNVKFSEIYTNIHLSSTAQIINTVEIIDTVFKNSIVGSFFTFEVINIITLQNVSISGTINTYQPIIYCYLSDFINFTSVSLQSNSKILPTFNDTIIYSSTLLSSALIILQNTETIGIYSSNFQKNVCPQCSNGLIFLANVINSSFLLCNFTENQILQGGGIAVRNITTIIQFFALTQGLNLGSQTTIMQGYQVFQNLTMILIQTNFTMNQVFSGGALFITIDDESYIYLNLSQVNFNNTAYYGTILRVVGYISQQFTLYVDQQNGFPGVYRNQDQLSPLLGTQKLPNDLTQIIPQIQILPNWLTNQIILGCEPGSKYDQVSQKCMQCSLNSYLLQGNQFDCKPCDLTVAFNCSGSSINLQPGYWRENNLTDQIIICPYPELCLSQQNYSCIEGHSGALCGSCDLFGDTWGRSYTKSSDRVCVACDIQVYQVLRTGIVFLFVFLGMNIAVNSTVNHITLEICVKYLRCMKIFVGARNRDALFAAVYLKILATHFIVVTLVLNMNLPIPSQLAGLFSGVGSPLNQMLLSQDCFLVKTELPLPLIYFRVILSFMYPFFFYLIFVMSKISQSGFDNVQVKRGIYPVGALFIIVYMQPNLFQILMGMVSCTNVFNKDYISIDTNYRCYTDQYWFYFYYFSLPLLISISIIVPFGLFLGLYTNRKALDTIKTRFKYGYLILGYSESPDKQIAIYWEIIVLYKKISTVALLNYFSGDGFNQGLLMLFTLLVYYLILKAISPYRSEVLNSADEQITLMQCYIMVVALLLNINNDTDTIIWVGLIVLLVLNVYSINFLFIGIFQDFKQDFQAFMTQYYYGQQCQITCPVLGRWFQERKVSTNRARQLWKKAYTEIVSWRHKYIELTENFQEDIQFEEAYTIIEQHRTGGRDSSQLFQQLKVINMKENENQFSNVNPHTIQIDDDILLIENDQNLNLLHISVEEQNLIDINEALNDTFGGPYVVYDYYNEVQPQNQLMWSLTLSNIGILSHDVSYVCCQGPDNQIGILINQSTPRTINIFLNGSSIFTSENPQQRSFIPLNFIEQGPASLVSSQCKQIPIMPTEKVEQLIEMHLSMDRHFQIYLQKVMTLNKHVSPMNISPFLVGCFIRKPLSSVYKRFRIDQENLVRPQIKVMKILSHQFKINEQNLIRLAFCVPHNIDLEGIIDTEIALKNQKQFTLSICYVMFSMHRYSVKIACIWKQERWFGQITVRSGGGPALLNNCLKQQKVIYVDSLVRFLETF